MALEVGSAYVTLMPSARGFGTQLKKVLGSEVPQAAAASGKTAGTSFATGFKGSLTGIKAAVGAVIGGAVVSQLKDGIDYASDLSESANKVEQTFGKASKQVNDFAARGAKSLGMTSLQARDAAARFGVFGKSAGLTGNKLGGFSTQMTQLATDMASFHNVDPSEMIEAMGSALAGETEPMRRFGVLMDDATMRTQAMKMGLIKTTKEALTPQQKVLTAHALMLAKTKDAQGDFARTSGGLANQQRILSASWTEAKGKLGGLLLPAFNGFVTMLNEKVLPGLTGLGGGLKAIWDLITTGNFSGALRDAFGWEEDSPIVDMILRIRDGAQGLFDLIVKGDFSGALRDAFGWEEDSGAVTFIMDLRDNITSVATFVRDTAVPALVNLGKGIANIVVPAIQAMVGFVVDNWTALKGLATVAAAMFIAYKTYTGTIAAFNAIMKITTITTKIMAIGQGILNAVMSANPIGLVVLALVGLAAGLVYAWKNSETFRAIVTSAWEGIKSVVSTVWTWLSGVFDNLKTWFTVTLPNAVNTVREKIVGAFDAIKSGLGSAFDWVKKNVFDRYVAAFKFIIGKAGDFGKNMAKAFRQVVRGIHTAINWLIDKALSGLVGAWNTIADKVGVLNDKKITVPQLPPLPPGWATGGYTGPGAKYQPAGIVHADEYVLRKEAVNKLRRTVGLSGLDHMNRTGEMPGYAKGGMVYQKMQAWLRTALPWARVTSSYRPGSITSSGNLSNHSMGRALDLVPSGKGTLMGIFNFLASKFPNAAELIYTPAGRRQIKNGRNMVYGGRVAADHHDHVHWAQALFNGAASGGSPLDLISSLLPPGVAAAISMAKIGYKALLGRLNAASPGTKGFNVLGAKGTDMIGTAVRGKIAELEASMDPGPGSHSATAADFKAGGGVERWRSTVLQALSIMGLPASLAGTTLRRMQQESGGNPRAINNWDSNARRGTPSKGLMQTIDSTYRAYAHPQYNRGPYDPLSNILASMRYALRTYGSLPRAYDRKGGYATGGLVTPTLYDTGGILNPGVHLVSNQTGKPETIRTYEQEMDLREAIDTGTRAPINVYGIKHDSIPEFAAALDYSLTRDRLHRRYPD